MFHAVELDFMKNVRDLGWAAQNVCKNQKVDS